MATTQTTKKRKRNRPAPESGTNSVSRFGSVPFLFASPRGAVAKMTPSGKFLGFYREGQKAGRPAKKTPLRREITEKGQKHLSWLGKLRFDCGKNQANKKSQEVRGKTAAEVLKLAAEKLSAGRDKRDIAELIANELGITSRRVRQIMSEKKISGNLQPA